MPSGSFFKIVVPIAITQLKARKSVNVGSLRFCGNPREYAYTCNEMEDSWQLYAHFTSQQKIGRSLFWWGFRNH